MEHTFKIEKELKITTENIVDCVLSCEAGGFDYWGELCSDEKDYEAARQRLAEREKADMKPCYEDVLAEILEKSKLTEVERMKRYAVCITDDDGGTGEAVFTVKNKTEARARGRLYIRQWQLPNGKIEYIRELAEGEEAVKFGRAAGY